MKEKEYFEEIASDIVKDSGLWITIERRGAETSIEVTWSLGGTESSYTGDEWERELEHEKDFPVLDCFLLRFWPDIPILKFREAERKLIKKGEEYVSDYYMIGTNGYKRLYLKELYDYLVANGKINQEEIAYCRSRPSSGRKKPLRKRKSAKK